MLKAGATLNGRALAQTAVTLIANTITAPTAAASAFFFTKVASAPKVQSGATVTYTYMVKNTGDTVLTVGITDDKLGTIISGVTLASGASRTFTKTQKFIDPGTYTNTATATGTDKTGASVQATATATVVVIAPPSDAQAPKVRFISPANGARCVSTNAKITATFSEAMNPLTITTATFILKSGTTTISGTVTYTGVTATFTPSSNLAPGTIYTVTIATGAKDLAGNPLAVDKVWSFITGAAHHHV